MRRLKLHQIDAASITDGYVPTVASGVLVYAASAGGSSTRTLLALTTAIGGAPEDVWDANDERVLTEVVP